MHIIVTNNPNKKIYSEAYDRVIYLGFTPDKELESNEVILLDNDKLELENYIISLKGVLDIPRPSVGKYDFMRYAKRNKNQILLNDKNTNVFDETKKGKHYFVALKGHYEIEI